MNDLLESRKWKLAMLGINMLTFLLFLAQGSLWIILPITLICYYVYELRKM